MSYMVIEALAAAERLADEGIEAEVIDVRALRPLDRDALIESVWKTGHLVVADGAWALAGMSAELIASVTEAAFGALHAAPRRVCFPDCPTPTSPALADGFYPSAGHIVAAVRATLALPANAADLAVPAGVELDKPNPAFTGPF
jgi:acetoin:2,6-dichlorophenolindophenol oxidoreductase subunit beta